MKAAKEAVGANPGAIALTEEARAWKGGRFRRKPKHFPRENHQGSCSCAFCAQEIQNILDENLFERKKYSRKSCEISLGMSKMCNHFTHNDTW